VHLLHKTSDDEIETQTVHIWFRGAQSKILELQYREGECHCKKYFFMITLFRKYEF
jgi:hypothetical protein